MISEDMHREYVRLSRHTFEVALRLLRAHVNDLLSPKWGRSQLSLEVQLAMKLDRLGTYGNLARVFRVTNHLNVSVGTMVTATRRVIRWLNRLPPDTVAFPYAARCWDLSAWAGSRFEFEGCFGATDGTIFLPRIHRRGIRGLNTSRKAGTALKL